jgi:multisubunit Na+/H+ antiporter MnhB subunit
MTTKQKHNAHITLIIGALALPITLAVPFLFAGIANILCPKNIFGSCDFSAQTVIWFGMHIVTVLWATGALVTIAIGIYNILKLRQTATRKKHSTRK